MLAVDERDDDERNEVVGDDERQDEHAQPLRLARADERQGAERERGVGRHRRAPAAGVAIAGVDREVDQHGQRHAADRGEQRQRDALSLAQLAEVELPPRLEPDHEEEHDHQAVVDPVAQILGHAMAADADAQLRRPGRGVAVAVDVRPDQRRDRRSEQDERAADLRAQEGANRRGEIARPGRAPAERSRRCGGVGHDLIVSATARLPPPPCPRRHDRAVREGRR